MGSFPEMYNDPEFICGYWGLQSLIENRVKGALSHQDYVNSVLIFITLPIHKILL